MIQVIIKENTLVARIAAYQLKSHACAIVFGRIICLHNISKLELLNNSGYLRHEVAHVKQWLREGYFLFPLKYLWYSLKHGYYHNPFEIEARAMENNLSILENVIIS
jgi:hypothetical protein